MAKTLGKSLFHGQNDWSGHGPTASSDFWKAPLNENFHFGGQQCSDATLLALIASLIASVETNFAILTTIIRHLKRRLKVPCLGPVHTYLVKTVTENAAFQKRSSEWRTPASHFRVDGPKRRFSNTVMSNIIYTTSIMHVSSEMVCVFVWTGKNYSNTQWRISVKYAVHELIIWLSLFSPCD